MTEIDREHIRLLSIFHYVMAGLSAIAGSIPLIHLSIGIALLAGAMDSGKNPPPAFVGWLMVLIGSVLFLFGWTLALLNFVAARSLKTLRRRTFCLVTSGLNCLGFPYGTILGVLTIMVLQRPQVKAEFDKTA